MFTRNHLRKWWNRALSRKILFSALDRDDRGYLYLTMRAFDEIRNADVGTIIVKILAKLKDALESPFVRRMETYGVEKTRFISALAVEWGHNKAEGWTREKGFARYLTALEFYAPSGWGFPD